jgi:hypothetical protein
MDVCRFEKHAIIIIIIIIIITIIGETNHEPKIFSA